MTPWPPHSSVNWPTLPLTQPRTRIPHSPPQPVTSDPDSPLPIFSSKPAQHPLSENPTLPPSCNRLQGSPSQKLIRIDFRIANLGSDLTDSVALGIVEHQIAPEREFELRVLRSPDLHKRAAYVLEVANRLGVDGLHLRPEDITRPRFERSLP